MPTWSTTLGRSFWRIFFQSVWWFFIWLTTISSLINMTCRPLICVTLSATVPDVIVTIMQSQSTKLSVELFFQRTRLGTIGSQVVINIAAQDLDVRIKYVGGLTLTEKRSFPQPSRMQVVLDEFNEWTSNYKLSLNPFKCQALQVCFRTNTPPHAELSIAGVPLNFVSEAIRMLWIVA